MLTNRIRWQLSLSVWPITLSITRLLSLGPRCLQWAEVTRPGGWDDLGLIGTVLGLPDCRSPSQKRDGVVPSVTNWSARNSPVCNTHWFDVWPTSQTVAQHRNNSGIKFFFIARLPKHCNLTETMGQCCIDGGSMSLTLTHHRSGIESLLMLSSPVRF